MVTKVFAVYEPGGREFESLRARHIIKGLAACHLAFFLRGILFLFEYII